MVVAALCCCGGCCISVAGEAAAVVAVVFFAVVLVAVDIAQVLAVFTAFFMPSLLCHVRQFERGTPASPRPYSLHDDALAGPHFD